jgi:hypothetical protein
MNNAGWSVSYEGLHGIKSQMGKTLFEVYENPEKYSYFQYNDAK